MVTKRDRRAKQVRLEEQFRPGFIGRRRTILGLFVLFASALVWRAVDQQIFEHDFLQSEGADRHLDVVEMQAHRGVITDRHGIVLAVSTPVDSVAANPRLLKPDNRTLAPLARALDMDPEDLRRRLAKYSHRHFVYLKRRLSPDQAEAVMAVAKEQGIRGVRLDREYKRYYPAGEVFSHVIGFTNIDDVGQEGLELAFNRALDGEPGAKRVMRDGRRKVVADIESIQMPSPGDNLALSLDRRLQFIAYRELKAAVKKHHAKAGSVVLLDVKTGEILAMVNQPAYNPNASRGNQGGRLRNRALTDVFEPGSTMKPFTIAAGLELGLYSPDSVIDTSPGYFHLGRARVSDHNNLGKIDLATILVKSSNVGAGKIALSIPKERLWAVMSGLGFGLETQTGFPGEAGGQLIPYQRWARIDQATLSYGYGISTTTLQLAQAYAVLAANGERRETSLLRQSGPAKGERVFSETTARTVRKMLEKVASKGGTAPKAAVPGYRVSGKTGTVKKLGRHGYTDDRYLALFAGMAPADDPRLVMVVMIDEPNAGKYYGGDVAAPVFSSVMNDALRILNVAPDAVQDGDIQLAQLARISHQGGMQ